MKIERRRALSGVVGGILFIFTAIIIFTSFGVLIAYNFEMARANLRAQDQIASRYQEGLSVRVLPGDKMNITNVGYVTSAITYVADASNGIFFLNQPQSSQGACVLSNTISLSPRASCVISVLGASSPGAKFGVLTTLGNIFWA